MLANTRNCLFQGISRSHKPQRKLHSSRKLNPQAERETEASQATSRKLFPYGSNEGKTRVERNKAKEQIGGKIHSTSQVKTLTRELYSLSLISIIKA